MGGLPPRTPAFVALRRRIAPLSGLLRNRLAPGGNGAWQLTAGGSIALLAGGTFGVIAGTSLATDPLVAWDHRVSVWHHQHATLPMTRVAEALTSAGSPVVLTAAGIATALILAYRKSWYRLLGFVLAIGGGALLNSALKLHFHRSRPVFDHPLIQESGFSFPSGHTMGAMLFYGWVMMVVVTQAASWRWRVLALALGSSLIFLIGLSRIHLGAHYPSDVLAAAAAGLAWLAFCLTGVETFKRCRA